MIKNLPQMQEMHVRSQGLEDLLEEGMATHFSILTWRIPWTEKPGGLQSALNKCLKMWQRDNFLNSFFV